MYQLTMGAIEQITKLCDTLYSFLFQEIKIGEYSVSMWALLAGTLFTTFIILWLVKKLLPVA